MGNTQTRQLSALALVVVVSLLLAPFAVFAETGANTEIQRSQFDKDDLLENLGESPSFEQLGIEAAGAEGPALAAAAVPTTTLAVEILSAPVLAVDNTVPADGPHAYAVEVSVTNTGTVTATNIVVELGPEFTGDWSLLTGEEPIRVIPELDPGETFYLYYFAQYPAETGLSFDFSVSATADNVEGLVEDTHNVVTEKFLSTGNSGIVDISTDITIGAPFTVTLDYELSNNSDSIHISPVGNTNFDPRVLRMLRVQVDLYTGDPSEGGALVGSYYDRVYIDFYPANVAYAVATYTFITLTQGSTELCPYTTVDYGTTQKYDKDYCTTPSTIYIEGELTFELKKDGTRTNVQQGEEITYTLRYTNSGSLPLGYMWVYDFLDPYMSYVAGSDDPSATITTTGTVGWYVGDVPISGTVGSTGMMTFTAIVDGRGADIPDGSLLVNYGHMGIDHGAIPVEPAITSTFTTTLSGPMVSMTKTDGVTETYTGMSGVYTIAISNTGSVSATNLVLVDTLPGDVDVVTSTITPVPDVESGGIITWYLSDLGPGGTQLIQIPYKVKDSALPSTITNTATLDYQNSIGHNYTPIIATDETGIEVPPKTDLSINKLDATNPIAAGAMQTYTLQITNISPTVAPGMLISDTLPDELVFGTVVTDDLGAAFTQNGQLLTWYVSILPASFSGEIVFTAQVKPDAVGTITNTATIESAADDPNPSDNSSSVVTTVGDSGIATIFGYVYEDVNGNGIRDAGEGGIADVVITLDGGITTTTNADGLYLFLTDITGMHTVAETDPVGYFSTTPNFVYVDVELGKAHQVDFGDLGIVPPDFAVIYGTVFEDSDHDGVQGSSEMGLPGISISSGEAVTSPVMTNNYGQYTLRFAVSGTVTITETNPIYYYVSTTPDVVQTDAVLNSSGPSPIDFGDYAGIKVTGQVFSDTNVNGAKDVAEVGLSGAIVAMDGISITTGSTGVYTFYTEIVSTDPITITETDPAGFISTNAVPGMGMSKADANTLRIDSPISGTVYSDSYFGDVIAGQVITISGKVWDDNGAGDNNCLANGLLDCGESGLAGAIVSLSSGLTQTTAADGLFLLYATPDMAITVTETNPSGYVSTNAIPGDIGASKVDNDTLVVGPLAPGATSANNLFGDVQQTNTALITGTVFYDENENGVLDNSEVGLPGITVTMEISGSGIITLTTNSAGQYQYAVAPGTNVRVTSEGPGGLFYPTTLESVILHPSTAIVYPNNNFGYSDNTNVAIIHGVVFNDANSDGALDFGELGLAGAVITLTLDSSVVATYTTSGNGLITGTYAFTVTVPGIYRIEEKNPPGYRSTTPDTVNVPIVALGSNYQVDFGDTDSETTSSIYGTVFDDLNSNGMFDPGEVGLPGVVISLTVSGQVVTDTTKANGQYSFEVPEPGLYTVREQDPALPGYHSTTPDVVNVDVVAGNSYMVDFGDALPADLMISKSDDPDPVAAGATLTYTLVYTNTGLADAHGVVVTDTLPAGVTFGGAVSVEPPMPTFTQTGQILTWYTPTLDAGVDGVIVYTVTVQPDITGTITNTVEISSNTPDADESNNLADESTNIGAPNLATIYGYVFEDANANGMQDAGELGISNTLITLDEVFTTTTDANGLYWFITPLSGTHRVVEADPDGYFSTTPNTVTLNVNLGNSYRVDFGDASTTPPPTFASIYGTVFEDVDGNGLQDAGELGIADVEMKLDGVITTTTNIYGSYTFSTTVAGTHTVVETDPEGYRSTTPNTVTLSVDLGGSYQVDFGDIVIGPPESATIYGTVFEDADGDGVWGVGELGIAGVEIELDGIVTTTTNIYGSYTFSTTVAGIHTVVETDPDGYFSTTPNTVILDVEFGNSYRVDFGDAVTSPPTFASIYGTVFEDVNGNGLQDVGELGIADVEISLDGVITTTTNSYGNYTFSTTVPGMHSVVETDPDGYFSTTPNQVHVEVTLGNGYQVDFGDASTTPPPNFATIYGTVFEDADGDGLWDAGEAGIGGVVISLDGVITTTTDMYGSYSFLTTVTGTHTIVETDPAGYMSTTPNEVHIGVELGNGYQVDFGDVLTSVDFAVIYGTVYEDKADSGEIGEMDANELGIEGVTVDIDPTITTTTNQYGAYTFRLDTEQQYLVNETDLPDYSSTTPNHVAVDAFFGNSYEVNFGDVYICTCDGDTCEEDDEPASAWPITVSVSQTHNFCDDSIDWLALYMERGDTYTVTTSATGERADTILALYAPDSTTLLVASDDFEESTDFSSQVVWAALETGTYFVKVSNNSGLTGCKTEYDVTVEQDDMFFLYLPIVMNNYETVANTGSSSSEDMTLVAVTDWSVLDVSPGEDIQGVITHICTDTYEIDDSWMLAKPIADGMTQTHSFDSNPSFYATDKDHVWFVMKQGDVVTFTVENVVNTAVHLELYDEFGVSLNITGTEQLVAYGEGEEKTYYLGVTQPPGTTSYGCVGEVGYDLRMDAYRQPMWYLYLPIVLR